MSDLYPNRERFEHARAASGGRIDSVDQPVDATAVPASLGGFRLISNALHHLRPDMARAVLADAVASQRGIAVFEALTPGLPGILSVLPTPLVALLSAPFIRPFRWRRLAWTYLLPVVPICGLWDGMMSALRIYSPGELRELVAGIPGQDGYVWDIDRLSVGRSPVRISYLIGRPR